MAKFDPEAFVEACKTARPEGQKAIREVVQQALTDCRSIDEAFGVPLRAGITPIHRSPDLTVLHFVWAPNMTIFPHNHEMFSVVGLYSGREDNVFWRRGEEGIEAAGATSLGPGEIATLGKDIIHSVTNPLSRRSLALHVYGGDFFDPPTPRKEWDHETLQERPWDLSHARECFEEGDRRASAY